MLRHAKGDRVRELFGIEGTQAALWHENLDTSQIYSQKREELARKIARETG
ncbi:MAG: hypothetical protein QM811_22615 [Pirellulales bacterium]